MTQTQQRWKQFFLINDVIDKTTTITRKPESHVAAGCGWSCDHLWQKLFHRDRVNQSFLSILTKAKERSLLTTPLKFSSPVVSFTQVRWNIFIEASLISIPAGPFNTRTKTVSLFHVAWMNFTAHCSLAKWNDVLLTTLQNIILDYAKKPWINICLNINLHKAINLMQMKHIKCATYVNKTKLLIISHCCKSNASQNARLIDRMKNTFNIPKSFYSIRLPNFFVNESRLYFGDGRNRVAFFIGNFDFEPERGSSFSRLLEDLKPTKFVT